jgi:hypothetical protein
MSKFSTVPVCRRYLSVHTHKSPNDNRDTLQFKHPYVGNNINSRATLKASRKKTNKKGREAGLQFAGLTGTKGLQANLTCWS